MEIEPCKILGRYDSKEVKFYDLEMDVSAHCNRVQVADGHTECVSIKLKKPATIEQVLEVLENWKPSLFSEYQLPSSPAKALQVLKQVDRPQPRLDRNIGNGFTVTVGRVRKCKIFDLKITLLSHNSVLGAAGGSILNAELAKEKGYL
jgi:aspartate-semialdehyde dehydrogenase